MRKIISASRRCDVISFHYSWLQNVFKEKRVILENPYFRNKKYEVSLQDKDIHSVVLWSKDFTNFVRNPGALEDKELFFQYTINGYPEKVENVRSMDDSIINLRWLIDNYGGERITVRFDPVLFMKESGNNIHSSMQERLNTFSTLLDKVNYVGGHNCKIVTSYIDINNMILKNLKEKNIQLYNPSTAQLKKFFVEMNEIANNKGFKLYSCADNRLNDTGIIDGSCINGYEISSITGEKCSYANDKSQRKRCGCTKSIDIGIYPYLNGGQKCGHNCGYCYVKGAI